MPETTITAIETRFEVQSVLTTKGGNERVTFSAVSSSDQKPENRVFAAFTPFGQIDIAINNPAALGLFEPGDEYRVTFEKI